MKIKLIWTGKTREQFINEGIQKYLALIKPFAEVSIIQVKEEKVKNISRMREKEGERILKLGIPYVLLDERGRTLSSVEFSGFIERRLPHVAFVLGGAFGVSDTVRNRAEEIISLSRMTLTHEMARLVLLEQLYRSFTIIHGRGYHH